MKSLFIYGHRILKYCYLENIIYKTNVSIQHIIDNIYLSDFRAADNKNTLLENHITHIINCAFNLPNSFPDDFKYLRLELQDTESQEIIEAAEKSYQFIKENSIDKNNNILIHCVFGKSRSATIVIYYLMKEKGWSYKKSLEYLRKIREIAQPNLYFEQQLLNKEKEFLKEKE